MKYVRMLLYAAVAVFGWCCHSATENQTSQTEADTSRPSSADELSLPDTLRMRPERQVIFFLPSDEEINQMTEQDKEGQIIETISDFIYYSSMVCDSLSVSGILCSPVTSPIIMTQDTSANAFLFDRKHAQHITGMIVYDGATQPEISYGVADYGEWMGIIKNKLKLH